MNRLRLEGELSDRDFASLQLTFSEFYDSISVIELNAAVKKRAAEPFPTILGTPDAIHLSSAILWREENPDCKFLFLTHGQQLSTAAMATGLPVLGESV